MLVLLNLDNQCKFSQCNYYESITFKIYANNKIRKFQHFEFLIILRIQVSNNKYWPQQDGINHVQSKNLYWCPFYNIYSNINFNAPPEAPTYCILISSLCKSLKMETPCILDKLKV